MTTPTVLMLAHAFPPAGGGGVQRSAKFARYLPECGWRPIVLTVRGEYYRHGDKSLLRDVEDIEVVRTSSLEPTRLGRRLIRRIGAGGLVGSLARLPLAVLNRCLLPDYQRAWNPFAVAAGVRIVRSEGCRAVFATGNPFSSLIAARQIASRTGVPYVADFRDPWTLQRYFGMPRLNLAHARMWERRIVRDAARIVVVDEQMRQMYAAEYPDSAGRIIVISNGFDLADFDQQLRSPTLPSEFTMVHVGALHAYRRGDLLMESIRRACEMDDAFRATARLRLVGDDSASIGTELPLDVEWTGYVDHRTAVRHMQEASLLLLPTGGQRYEQTGKVFEYVAAGCHVLALAAADGAVADVLDATGGGTVVGSTDPAAVASVLLDLFRRWHSVGLSAPEAVPAYSRPQLACRLAELLTEVTR